MQYLVLATDYDGTLAQQGRVDEPTLAALGRLRRSGRKIILVTGASGRSWKRSFRKSTFATWWWRKTAGCCSGRAITASNRSAIHRRKHSWPRCGGCGSSLIRWAAIPPHQRPHYAPTERLAILELRAARGWSLAQTAERFLVTAATISSWQQRINEGGPGARCEIAPAGQQIPRRGGLPRSAAQNALPQARQTKDRRGPGPSRLAPERIDHCPHGCQAAGSQTRAAETAARHPDPRRQGQAAEPCLARRLDGRADRRRLLDAVAPVRLAAALALLLVGGRRCRPFLAASPGQHHVLLPAVVEGGVRLLGPDDQQDRPGAEIHRVRPGQAV